MPVDLDESGAPHPRDRDILIGQGRAAASLQVAEAAGRLHHAWLLGGPEGIGKATLAYRFARHLLASPAEHVSSEDGLGVNMAGRTARQISAGAHPNLIAIERAAPDGEKAAPKAISVEAVRRALGFFTTTAADGGRRICIVDPVEDLTTQAANALLKTVEEPPPNTLILIVSHAPQRVLPTVRSRCRLLPMTRLAEADVGRVLASLAPTEPALLDRAAKASDGSVRRALVLLDERRLAILDEIGAVLNDLPTLRARRVMALAEKLAERRADGEFTLALETVQGWVASRIESRQNLAPARLAPLAEVCENLLETARSVEVYNLDKRSFLVSAFRDLAEAVRQEA